MHVRRMLTLPLAVTLITAPGCELKNTAAPAGLVTAAARTLTLTGVVRVPNPVLSQIKTTAFSVHQVTSPSPSPSPRPTPTPTATPSPTVSLGAVPANVTVRFAFIGPDGRLSGTPQSARTGSNGAFTIQLNVNTTDVLLCLADLGTTAGGQRVQVSNLVSVRNLELNPNQSYDLTPGTTTVAVAEMALAAGQEGTAAVEQLLALANGTAGDPRAAQGLIALESSVSAETTQQRQALQMDRAATLLATVDTLEELDQVPEALGTALSNAVVRVLKKLDVAKESTLGKALALVREALTEVLIAAEGKLGSDKDLTGLQNALLAAGDQVANDTNLLKRIGDNAAADLVDEVANATGPVDTTAPIVQPSERPIPTPFPSGVSGASGTAGGNNQPGQQGAGGGGSGL